MFDQMSSKSSSWLMAKGEQSAIVLSSRVRLARNIKEMVYPPYAKDEDRSEVVDFVNKAIESCDSLNDGKFYTTEEIDKLNRAFLIERHLISPEFMIDNALSGLFIGSEEKLSIMINEEDHLRIQSITSGLSLTNTFQHASKVESELSETLEFDYDMDFGYLTSCPTNVGTGMRASVLIHLAGLVLTKEIDSVIDHITKLGFVFRGFYGEGSDVWGNLFQISNQTTLGRSESDIVESLTKITKQIIELENKSREELMTAAGNEIADKIWRAYGILRHARVLTNEETMNLLSAVRLGVAMNTLENISIELINELLLFSQPAHLQKYMGENLEPSDYDVARATFVRERLEVIG